MHLEALGLLRIFLCTYRKILYLSKLKSALCQFAKFRNMKIRLLLLLFLSLHSVLGAKSYQRVVSLAPSFTENIYALGAANQLVGCTEYCKQAKADGKPVVSSFISLNVEKLVALKPDLVLASGMMNPEQIAQIRKFGIEVKQFNSPKSYKQLLKELENLGMLLGKKNACTEVLADIQKEVEQLKAERKNQPKLRMFFQIGANPIFGVIPQTFMADYISFLNAENILKQTNNATVTAEHVLAENPDCLIIASMGGIDESQVAFWQRFSDLAAVKRKQVHVVNSETACIPTPFAFLKTLRTLNTLLSHDAQQTK